MARVGVGGLVSLVAFVAIIASISRMTSHCLTIPGGVPGGLSALLGAGGATRDLLQTTTTESLIHRIIRGGMVGLGGRIVSPPGLRSTTTGRTRLSTRSAGRSYTRFQNMSTPYTVTRLASAGIRVFSSELSDTKTTVQLHRQSTHEYDLPGSTPMIVEASVSYETPTTVAPKIPATLEIIPQQPPNGLIETGTVTTQPTIVLPTFTEAKVKKQTNGEEPETPNVDVVTTESSPELSVEFHYTTLTYIHQTNVRKRITPSLTPPSSEAVTEALQTGDITSVHTNSDAIVTDTQTGTESPTNTERIDELTTGGFTGGETSFAESTRLSGSGKTISVTGVTYFLVNPASVISSTDIAEHTRTVGLLNADDKPTGGAGISRKATALTNGTFTRPMSVDGASTIGPLGSSNHTTLDVTTQNNASGVGTIDGFIVTGHPQSKAIPSMQKRDTTVALDHDKATQRDNPSTMAAYSEATHTRLIVGGDTTTSQLITDNVQNSTSTTDAPSNIKEISPVIGEATTTYSQESEQVTTGATVSTVNQRVTSTDDATIVASQEMQTVTTLSTSVGSQEMSTRVTTQEGDISKEGHLVKFEPTASNEKEAASRFITDGNGKTRTSDGHGESSTNEQTTIANESDNITRNELPDTKAYTMRHSVYYSTEPYTPMEHRESSSTHSNVKFDISPTTSAFETISDSTESTNDITTDSSVHARDSIATRLAFVNKASISTPYPVTTSKTSPASNTDSRISLPTTTYRTPYAIHLVKPKPTQTIALATQISPSQDIYGSKTSNSNSETNSVTTRDAMTTEEINSTTNYAEDFSRDLPDDGIATPSALNTSQSKLCLTLGNI